MKIDLSKTLGCRASLHIDDNDMQTPVVCAALPRIGYFEVHYYGDHAKPIHALITAFDEKKDDVKELIQKALPLLFREIEVGQKKALKLRIMNVLYGQPEDEDLF